MKVMKYENKNIQYKRMFVQIKWIRSNFATFDMP